jgi:hypothetical protein
MIIKKEWVSKERKGKVYSKHRFMNMKDISCSG